MNNRFILSLTMFSLALFVSAQSLVAPAIPRNEQIEQKIEALLKKMTLEEKVGQMTELTIDMLQKHSNSPQDIENANEFQLDEEKLATLIGKHKVGSFLNVPNSIAQTPEKWQEIIKRIQEVSMQELGIPNIYGVDQIHGTTYTLGGTLFPQGINMGASFNRALMRESSRISAYETKAGSIPWTYAPVTDLGRDPRWSRMWESYGEDAYLNAEMGRESVLGFQGDNPNSVGDNNVAACMKHYMESPYREKTEPPPQSLCKICAKSILHHILRWSKQVHFQ